MTYKLSFIEDYEMPRKGKHPPMTKEIEDMYNEL